MDLKTCLGYVEKLNKSVPKDTKYEIVPDKGVIMVYPGGLTGNKKSLTPEEVFGDPVDLKDFDDTLEKVVYKVMWDANENGKIPYEINLGNPESVNGSFRLEYISAGGVTGAVEHTFDEVAEICKDM